MAAGARIVLTIAGLFVATVLALKVLVLLLEPGVTYHPVPVSGLTPAAYGLPFEEIFIEAVDGARIHAWLIPGSRTTDTNATRRTVIRFHGNAENSEGSFAFVEPIRAAGHDLFLVDYRGYGRSRGRLSEQGVYLDGESAYRHVREVRQVAPWRIVLWGRSIGAAVAVDVASRFEVGGLVLESPFTSARDLLRAGRHWVFYGLSFFGSYRFDSIGKIGNIHAPVLLIHGTADDIAPFDLGRRLFERAPGRKEMLVIDGGGHNDLWAYHGGVLRAGILRFLTSLPAGPAVL